LQKSALAGFGSQGSPAQRSPSIKVMMSPTDRSNRSEEIFDVRRGRHHDWRGEAAASRTASGLRTPATIRVAGDHQQLAQPRTAGTSDCAKHWFAGSDSASRGASTRCLRGRSVRRRQGRASHGTLAGLGTGIGGDVGWSLVIVSDVSGSGVWNGLGLGLGTTTLATMGEAVSFAPEVSLKASVNRLFRFSAEAVVIKPASRPKARIGFFMMPLRRRSSPTLRRAEIGY
jgi:hypothetical protein